MYIYIHIYIFFPRYGDNNEEMEMMSPKAPYNNSLA